MSLKYFSAEEFLHCRPSCELSQMDALFMQRLDNARELAGVPFKINSAFRTVDYEIEHGRAGTSSHCKGLAVDIACSSNSWRFAIVTALVSVGFKRLGIGRTFIHVDCDECKIPSFWLY